MAALVFIAVAFLFITLGHFSLLYFADQESNDPRTIKEIILPLPRVGKFVSITSMLFGMFLLGVVFLFSTMGEGLLFKGALSLSFLFGLTLFVIYPTTFYVLHISKKIRKVEQTYFYFPNEPIKKDLKKFHFITLGIATLILILNFIF